jgi:hypothetical protein
MLSSQETGLVAKLENNSPYTIIAPHTYKKERDAFCAKLFMFNLLNFHRANLVESITAFTNTPMTLLIDNKIYEIMMFPKLDKSDLSVYETIMRANHPKMFANIKSPEDSFYYGQMPELTGYCRLYTGFSKNTAPLVDSLNHRWQMELQSFIVLRMKKEFQAEQYSRN